ncbi:hypothetical protein IL38_16460 [Actinopolyspora erythraea]|uniref:Uncharacterized protein n=2 Tax=Actinopolyspora erythraea TaxID=414996 RepID=A0ABR4X1N8_9ACTN|nr:hypothetical protein IL38_16460 [Actinopolyspora erythraea]
MRDVVREVMAEVAPEELPLVDGLTQSDDATAVRRLRSRRGRREPLGFGWTDVLVAVTPVVWLTLDQMAQKIAASTVDGSVKGAKAALRKVFRRKTAPVIIPPLTPGQLDEVRKRVLETAIQRGLSPERSETVADAVVARLVLATTREDAPGSGGSLTTDQGDE